MNEDDAVALPAAAEQVLTDTPWASLRTGYRELSGAGTPPLLRGLLDDSPGRQIAGYEHLDGEVMHHVVEPIVCPVARFVATILDDPRVVRAYPGSTFSLRVHLLEWLETVAACTASDVLGLAAAADLATMTRAVDDAVLRFVRDPDPAVRRRAVSTVGHLLEPAAAAHLRGRAFDLLTDDVSGLSRDDRADVAHAVGAWARPPQGLREDPDPLVRLVSAVSPCSSESPEALRTVLEALHHPERVGDVPARYFRLTRDRLVVTALDRGTPFDELVDAAVALLEEPVGWSRGDAVLRAVMSRRPAASPYSSAERRFLTAWADGLAHWNAGIAHVSLTAAGLPSEAVALRRHLRENAGGPQGAPD